MEEIGDEAFRDCPNLGKDKQIKTPQSLKKIGKQAFFNCRNMVQPPMLNEGLEEIGYAAFYNYCNRNLFSKVPDSTEIFILPSTVKKFGSNMINTDLITKMGFRNYKGQDIPEDLFDMIWLVGKNELIDWSFYKSDGLWPIDADPIRDIYLFEGDSMEPYMRIDATELMGANNKSDKLRKLVAKTKEKEQEKEK